MEDVHLLELLKGFTIHIIMVGAKIKVDQDLDLDDDYLSF